MNKTEKRRKTPEADVIKSQAEADETLARMRARDDEMSKILEEAQKEMMNIAVVAQSKIVSLDAQNETDHLRLKAYYDANPPQGKTKRIKLDHGLFGYKLVKEQIKLPSKADEKEILIERINKRIAQLERHIEANPDDDAAKDTLAVLRASLKEKTTIDIMKSELKHLDSKMLEKLGIEVIPAYEEFYSDVQGGRLKDIEKIIKGIGIKIKSAS